MTIDEKAIWLNKLTDVARQIVARVIDQNPGIVAAYSDGSLARGDVVRGSDVDIGFIIPGSERRDKTIHRELIDGVVFEWGFFTQKSYENVDEILTDAGFTHDIDTAKIWYDPQNFLSEVQQKVREKYIAESTIRTRVNRQIQTAKKSYARYRKFAAENNLYELIQPLISLVRSLFAVPTAALNKPVTNTRAYLYCKRDAKEMLSPGYAESVLDILGTKRIRRIEVEELLTIAYHVYDASNFPQDRIDTFKAHLEIVNYLLEINETAGATWPLLFWSMAWMRDLDKERQKSEIDRLFNFSLPIRQAFGLVQIEDLLSKQRLIEPVIRQAKALVADKFHRMNKKSCPSSKDSLI